MTTMTQRFGASMIDGLDRLGSQDRYAKLGLAARHLRAWITVSRERAYLANMTEAQLEDLGLTQKEAWIESQKPCWMLDAAMRQRFGL